MRLGASHVFWIWLGIATFAIFADLPDAAFYSALVIAAIWSAAAHIVERL